MGNLTLPEMYYPNLMKAMTAPMIKPSIGMIIKIGDVLFFGAGEVVGCAAYPGLTFWA